jgi:pimeloyl-ACP methyl ester carboxylesterase
MSTPNGSISESVADYANEAAEGLSSGTQFGAELARRAVSLLGQSVARPIGRMALASAGRLANRRGAGLLALAALAGSYLVVRSKTKQAERENPPTGRFIEVDGVRLHYVEQGEGPVLFLIHGNAVMAEDFRLSGLMGKLARNFRVIAFDRPGYGYSDRPRTTIWTPETQAKLLQRALDLLGVEQAIVLGHSLGSLVALSMALQAPDRVRGLVLLSGYYYPSLRVDSLLFATPAIPIIGDLMRYTFSPLVSRLMWPLLMKQAFSPRKRTANFMRTPVWMTLRPKQVRASAADALMMVTSAAALHKHYPELKMPVSILAGEGDLVASAEGNSRRLHEALPQSSLRLFPETGHMMQHLVPDDIATEVNQLSGQAPGVGSAGQEAQAAAPGSARLASPAMAAHTDPSTLH